MKITRAEHGFVIHDRGRTLPVQFPDVVAVEGTKVNKVTYDENYLVLTKADGEKIAVGELTRGFAEFEQAICTALKRFPREWRMSVEKAQTDETVALWATAST